MWKKDICKRPQLKCTNSIWRPCFNVAETLQCTAIVWSFCGLMTGYSFQQVKPKKGTLQKQLTVNTLHSHLLKKSFLYLNLTDKIDPLVNTF